MANAPIGNNILEGSLGVVQAEFNDIDMGKTTEDTELERIEDIKDIMYQQDGTQPYDMIPTGQAYRVIMTIGEITTTRLEQIVRGFTKSSIGGNSANLGRDIYRSGRDNFAKKLVLKRVDSDGVKSTNTFFHMTFYSAMPIITGNLQWGADTQRNLSMEFYCFFDSTNSSYGYIGYPSSLGILAA